MGINTVAYTNGNYKAYFPIEEIRKYVEPLVEQSAIKNGLEEKQFNEEIEQRMKKVL